MKTRIMAQPTGVMSSGRRTYGLPRSLRDFGGARSSRNLGGNESGLVAIMVTLIIMSLLTLVTIGFSRLMLREQRQAIDRQLGAQAFYAAESGINDAIKSGVASKNDCISDLQINGTDVDRNLSAADGVQYTCVTVDAGGGDIVMDSIATSESTTFPINANNVSSLTFFWQDADDSTDFAAGTANFPQMPSLSAWGTSTGVLRATIVPIPSAGFNRDNMSALARTYFLYPSTNPGDNPQDVTYLPGGDIAPGYYSGGNATNSSGQVISGQCSAASAPRFCSVTINNLQTSGAQSYYVRLKAIYRDVKVSIQGRDASNNNISLPGAQYLIDATGRSNDVLKRIQVRVPLTSSFSWPEFVVDSASSVCKRLIVNPSSASNADCKEDFPVNMNVDPLGLD